MLAVSPPVQVMNPHVPRLELTPQVVWEHYCQSSVTTRPGRVPELWHTRKDDLAAEVKVLTEQKP